jgi:hypothetical protein
MMLLVVLLSCVLLARAEYAVDVSGAVYPSAWQCLRGQGFGRAIIRAYQSSEKSTCFKA